MALSRLTLNDFRNHAALEIRPQAQFLALHGTNGAGKTNILEAVSLLVPGRGLRRAAMSDMVRSQGNGGFTIVGEVGGNVIGTGVSAEQPERRKVRVNESNAAINSLAEWLSVIWLTPAMDRLFADGAAARRRFLDRLVLAINPGHARHSSRYEKAMQQRNRLLAGGVAADPLWLDALEAQMAESGNFIQAARIFVVEALSAQLLTTMAGPFATPQIRLIDKGATGGEDLASVWRKERNRDAAAGRTLIGPHRADLEVLHSSSGQVAEQCSTGEQKALLLSLILAHAALVSAQRDAPPILLLDEVAAHLDPSRRAALFGLLADTGAQVWMTGTEPELFNGIGTSAQLLPIGQN
ncbi:DNA replication/repair protein RecF [Sphingorhabdus sp.]|jgi:DNA replication and repair protein RecF|uniref:DNA replication/repair protein RecF n=1 Tax=Sphingorhabdus sp. TaxID=1902408 RepID=UPI0037C97FC6